MNGLFQRSKSQKSLFGYIFKIRSQNPPSGSLQQADKASVIGAKTEENGGNGGQLAQLKVASSLYPLSSPLLFFSFLLFFFLSSSSSFSSFLY